MRNHNCLDPASKEFYKNKQFVKTNTTFWSIPVSIVVNRIDVCGKEKFGMVANYRKPNER